MWVGKQNQIKLIKVFVEKKTNRERILLFHPGPATCSLTTEQTHKNFHIIAYYFQNEMQHSTSCFSQKCLLCTLTFWRKSFLNYLFFAPQLLLYILYSLIFWEINSFPTFCEFILYFICIWLMTSSIPINSQSLNRWMILDI